MINHEINKKFWSSVISFLLIVIFFSINGCKKEDDYVSKSQYPVDGPYVFPNPQGYDLVSVNSERYLVHKIISKDYFTVQSALFNELTFQVKIRENLDIEPYEYTTDKKVLVLSDIEGNLPLFLEFLGSNDVINDQLEWTFGGNHLVFIGDVFDRGVDVTALLWYVYQLEAEAEKHGGKVHLLLGNHEALVMSGDMTYSNSKYLEFTTYTRVPMEELFSDESILGQWLRTKNTIEKINDVLYCHGGISDEFIEKNYAIDEVNQTIREYLGIRESVICSNDEDACFLFGKNGPLWYNGYFHANGITLEQVENILSQLQAEQMVVGHSKVKKVKYLFDKNIIAIDTHTDDKHSLGQYSESYCEGLLIEDGIYYRVNNLGDKEIF